MAVATKLDLKAEAAKGLYVGAGVADLAVEYVRETVADVQTRLAAYQKGVSARVTDVQKQVKGLDFEPRTLRAQAKAAPAKVQTLVDQNVSSLNDTYVGLAKRGEGLIGRIRSQESTQATVASAETTVAKAKATKTTATKSAKSTATTAKKAPAAAKKSVAPSKAAAKSTSTAAKKTASAAADAVTDAAGKIGD